MSFPGGMLGLQNSLKKKKKSYEMMWHNIFEFRKRIFLFFFRIFCKSSISLFCLFFSREMFYFNFSFKVVCYAILDLISSCILNRTLFTNWQSGGLSKAWITKLLHHILVAVANPFNSAQVQKPWLTENTGKHVKS